jgi:nitroreductase
MPEFTKVLTERRSVRHYTGEAVPEEMVDKVLEAVQWSPSWANTQCWEIVRVKDKTIRVRLQETMSKGNPATDSIVSAPVLFGICGKLNSSGYYKGAVTTKFGDWFMYDLGIATQSLCLAAENYGLGTVIAGLFDHRKAAEVLRVPQGYELVSLIPMGYPAKKTSAPKRREIREFLHIDGF